MGYNLLLFLGITLIIILSTLLFMYSIRLVMTSSTRHANKVDSIPKENEEKTI